MTDQEIDDQITITISDAFGSRFYQTKRSIKRVAVISGAPLSAVVIGSISGNALQYNNQISLLSQNKALENEIVRFDSENSNLQQIISNKAQTIEGISAELVNIEINSGVETSDQMLELEERIRLIADYYSNKDAEFTQIGSRVQQIEGLIGLS